MALLTWDDISQRTHVKISAGVLAHSVTEDGQEICTFLLNYPRPLHAELMTHRKFSRNASSSRAISVTVLVQQALDEMYTPLFWGLNQPRMQSKMEELDGDALEEARSVWTHMAQTCANGVKRLGELGLHKQWANRPLEWFSNITVLVTATDYDNFYALRNHMDAFPEFHLLAERMENEHRFSIPRVLKHGEWHLPFVTEVERTKHDLTTQIQLSVARSARTSYLRHGKETTLEQDGKLYHDLVNSEPAHASPTEHQATPDKKGWFGRFKHPDLHGNLDGFIQYRKAFVEQQRPDLKYLLGL